MYQAKYNLSDRTNMFYWQTNRNITPQDQKTIFLDRSQTVSLEDSKAAITYGMIQAGKSSREAEVTNISKPIPFGSVNNVLKATLFDGTKLVVRMHPYGVQNGYFWVESLAAQQAANQDVPTFKTYWIDDTFQQFNFNYMIMSRTAGKPLQELWPLDHALDQKLTYETGLYVAKIHQTPTKGYGFFSNIKAKQDAVLLGQYPHFKDHIFAGLNQDFDFLIKQSIISPQHASQIETILNQHDDLFACPQPVLIHNDIADWNELSDGKHIIGIMDWDECFSGDPVMDFAQWSLFFDDNRLKHFLSGYQSIASLPDGYTDKDHLFRLRYVISKLHLRKKRAIVIPDSKFLDDRIKRGVEVLQQELKYFGIK